MKIAPTAKQLKSMLTGALRLGTGDVTHPGFNLLLLEATKKGVLRASVVNAHGACRLAEVTPEAEGVEPGAVALPLARAQQLAQVLPDTDVQVLLTVVDNGPGRIKVLRIKGGDLLLKLPTADLDQTVPFPTPPDIKSPDWKSVKAEDVRAISSAVAWAASATMDRANLGGVHLMPTFSEGCDGNRLARIDVGIVDKEALVPPAGLAVAGELAADQAVRTFVTENHIWFQTPRFMLMCRMITESKYPDTSMLYLALDGVDAIAAHDPSARSKMNHVQIDRGAMQAAAANMSAVFVGGKDRDAPLLKFLVRDGALTTIMRNQEGEGIDIAQGVMWKMEQVIDDDAMAALQSTAINAKYVHAAISKLPKSDMIHMTWLNRPGKPAIRDRMQFASGNVRIVVMARGD